MTMEELSKKNTNYNFYNFYRIVWFLNNICNINCSYCEDFFRKKVKNENSLRNISSQVWKDISDEIPEKYIRKIAKNIKLISEYNNYKFKIYGGETTLYPSLPKFLDILYEEFNISTLKFSTNGLARPFNYYKDFLHYPYDSFLFQVTIHLEFYRESIKKIIDFFLENNVKVQINFLFDINRKEFFYQIFNEFYKRYFNNKNCTIIPFIIYKDAEFDKFYCNYTEQDKEEFSELLRKCKSVDPFKKKNDDFERLKKKINIKYNESYLKNKKVCVHGTNGIMINHKCHIVPACPKIKFSNIEKITPLYLLNEIQFKNLILKKTRCNNILSCQKSTLRYHP